MRIDIVTEPVDAAFEELGEPKCSYQPPGGGALVDDILLIVGQPDGEATFGDTRARIETTLIDVRASEVASPVRDGVFTVGVAGPQYRINAAPERRDARRLVWRCAVVPVA